MSPCSDGDVARDPGDGASATSPDGDSRTSSEHVLRVRLGHGANCSSIGSVVDTLFVTATVGAAVFAAVVAALAKEPVRVSSATRASPEPKNRGERSP